MKGDLAFAIPGDLDTPTGGYIYDKRMIAELRALGWRPEMIPLGNGFPYPTALAKAAAKARLMDVPKGRPIVLDGLAYGVMPEAGEALRETHPLIALVHHPLALESGVSPEQAKVFAASERQALASVRHVVVTSPSTKRELAANYEVAPDRITVAVPGTERVKAAPRKLSGMVALLAVGAVVPRKGYDLLVEALATLADLPWRLTIVGDCGRSPDTTAKLLAAIEHHQLAARISIENAVSDVRLRSIYAVSELFVLPSRHEGFGMAYAEAIANGLPVIGTTAGAIPDTVPATAGILVPPDNVPALTATLRHLIENHAARENLAAGARTAAAALPTWRESAELFSRAIERVV